MIEPFYSFGLLSIVTVTSVLSREIRSVVALPPFSESARDAVRRGVRLGNAGLQANSWASSPRASDSGRGEAGGGGAIAERRIAELRAKLTMQTSRTEEALAKVLPDPSNTDVVQSISTES